MTGGAAHADDVDRVSPPSANKAQQRSTLVIILIVGLLLAGVVGFAMRAAYVLSRLNRPFEKEAAAMQRPENYVPAELYLARLWQSDPKLMHSDSNGMPPDWMPPEIGRFQPHYFNIGDGFSIDHGGGMIDSFGYDLTPDRAESSDRINAYTLSYHDDNGEHPLDHFKIPASERVTEEEFVRLGLAELSRREASIKSDSPLLFGVDPVGDRCRLLAQHPEIAHQLESAVADHE